MSSQRREVEGFIDWINLTTRDETKRCRLLLTEVLLRLEQVQKEVERKR